MELQSADHLVWDLWVDLVVLVSPVEGRMEMRVGMRVVQRQVV